MRGAASAAASPTPAFSSSRLRIGVSSLCDLFGGNVACQSAASAAEWLRATAFLPAFVLRSATANLIGFLPVGEDRLSCLRFVRIFETNNKGAMPHLALMKPGRDQILVHLLRWQDDPLSSATRHLGEPDDR
jgi:hypothetical protein